MNQRLLVEIGRTQRLEILNSLKRTVLFVVEDERAIGIVHMHDLLRIGVV